MIWAVLFYVVAVLLDILTTVVGLTRGAREANPVIAWLQRRFGDWWVLWKAALSAPAAVWCYTNDVAWPLVALGLALLTVAGRNARHL